jgi:signal transduction histidine kinase
MERFWTASGGVSADELHQVSTALQRASAVASRTPILLAVAVLGIALAAAGAAWFLVVRPLLREILRVQAALGHEARAARAADRAKTEFLANVTHELRTPMNGVLGVADLLETQALDADGREMLEVLKSSATEQVALIDELLDITRIESGVLRLTAGPFDPARALREVLSLTAPVARRKGIDLALQGSLPAGHVVSGDEAAFRRICVNLVGNAIKFTEAGTVRAGLAIRAANGRARLSLAVTDTGCGIAEEDRARIFERFVQVDGSLSRRGEGTGLGLAITRALVDLMGGRIEVESAPGRGSTFRVELDLAVAEEAGERLAA